jgi:DNA-binding MarR family transcriptional regulator
MTATTELAAALRVGIGLLVRRLRQLGPNAEDLTLSETSALARLDRGGPMSAAALARQEQISPQSMGTTLARLQVRGLVARQPDPHDGRRVLVSLTPAGDRVLHARRAARTETLAAALADGFTAAERRTLAEAATLMERLAERL